MPVERDQVRAITMLGILLMAAVLGLWLPMHLREVRLEEAIVQASQGGSNGRVSTTQLASLAQETAGLQAGMESGRHTVPQEAQLAELLKSLSAELAALHVTDPETQSQATLGGSDYSVIPVTLRFHTTFINLYEFLSQVESMHRLVRVTRLDVSKATGDPSTGAGGAGSKGQLLSVNLELCTFFAPAEGAKP